MYDVARSRTKDSLKTKIAFLDGLKVKDASWWVI
jgi:hypothetical protein